MTPSDTQSQILGEAAEHEAGLAAMPKIPAAARNAVFRSMLKGCLLTEVPALPEHAGCGWRQDEAGAWIAPRIIERGRAAIGLAPAQDSPGEAVAAPAQERRHTGADSGDAPWARL
ncbi:hypothetical protein ACLF3G_04480 [Falsiroseomonas sp. HC035]|uniref:hypothetical protein n=1 Tax=Falsiroseomonas sp. HC035 TaxID=3390999 RepID=UPI003D31604F